MLKNYMKGGSGRKYHRCNHRSAIVSRVFWSAENELCNRDAGVERYNNRDLEYLDRVDIAHQVGQ